MITAQNVITVSKEQLAALVAGVPGPGEWPADLDVPIDRLRSAIEDVRLKLASAPNRTTLSFKKHEREALFMLSYNVLSSRPDPTGVWQRILDWSWVEPS